MALYVTHHGSRSPQVLEKKRLYFLQHAEEDVLSSGSAGRQGPIVQVSGLFMRVGYGHDGVILLLTQHTELQQFIDDRWEPPDPLNQGTPVLVHKVLYRSR